VDRALSFKQIAIAILLSAILLILGTACQGPAGPDGKDSRLTDSLPPQIEWISPEPGVEVDSSLLIQVHAFDNIGVYRVSIYIAGFEYAGNLVDTAAGVFSILWESGNFPEGPYPLMARVWDESRQTGTTPVRIIQVNHP